MRIKILDIDLVKMTDDVYFSDKYSDYVSNSKLGLLNPCEGGSVQKYKEGFTKGFNPSFVTGTAIHELVLQPDLFFLADDVGKPTAKMGAMADLLYDVHNKKGSIDLTDCEKVAVDIQYYPKSLSDKRIQRIYDESMPYITRRMEYESVLVHDKEPIYLDTDNIIRVTAAVHNLKQNEEIQDLLNPFTFDLGEPLLNRNEDAIIATVALINDEGREHIIKIKQKMDNFWYDPHDNFMMLNDLKTTGRFIDQFHESFYKYRYFRQIGMYSYFTCEYLKKAYNIDKINFKSNILLSCTIPDFRSGVFKINNEMVLHGVWAFREIFKILMDNYDEIYS